MPLLQSSFKGMGYRYKYAAPPELWFMMYFMNVALLHSSYAGFGYFYKSILRYNGGRDYLLFDEIFMIRDDGPPRPADTPPEEGKR